MAEEDARGFAPAGREDDPFRRGFARRTATATAGVVERDSAAMETVPDKCTHRCRDGHQCCRFLPVHAPKIGANVRRATALS